MAHLKTQATQGNPEERARWKLALSRGLLERGWGRDDMLDLYRFVDWLMALPEDLQRQHETTLEQDHKQKEGRMPHLTVWERRGIEKGEEIGSLKQARRAVVQALELRFKEVPASIREAVGGVEGLARLEQLLELAIVAGSIAAFEEELVERSTK